MQQHLCELSHLSIISVLGEKAKDMLQGQLSCDINQLNSNHYERGVLCNLKGRILAMMDVLDCHEPQLILEKNLVEPTLKSLQKVAMLSQVRFHQSNNYTVLGLLGTDDALQGIDVSLINSDNNLLLNEHEAIYWVADDMYIMLCEKKRAHDLLNAYGQAKRLISPNDWHLAMLKQGLPRIYPDTRGLFLPHRLGLQDKGYLSFNKGCYKGQEIIARMHYLGQLKHEVRIMALSASDVLKPGSVLVDEHSSREVGEVIDVCDDSSGQAWIMASVLKDAHEPFVIKPPAQPLD